MIRIEDGKFGLVPVSKALAGSKHPNLVGRETAFLIEITVMC